jgi:hypothetical protein
MHIEEVSSATMSMCDTSFPIDLGRPMRLKGQDGIWLELLSPPWNICTLVPGYFRTSGTWSITSIVSPLTVRIIPKPPLGLVRVMQPELNLPASPSTEQGRPSVIRQSSNCCCDLQRCTSRLHPSTPPPPLWFWYGPPAYFVSLVTPFTTRRWNL